MDLVRANFADAEKLLKMQKAAFQDLYAKYQDTETSPAAETIEKIFMRLKQTFTYYYFINVDDITVGAIRVVDQKNPETPKRISPIFIAKQYRRKGYAQMAIQCAEKIHGSQNWELETIMQEKRTCCLYEKMGYCQTGKTQKNQ